MKLDSVKGRYFSLILIYVFTVLVVLYVSSVYVKSLKSSDVSSLNELVVSKYSTLYDNVYNYSLEHLNFKIYVGSSFSVDDEVLFIDSNKISDKNLNRLISDFGYRYNINKGSVPFYIVFSEGKIKEIVHD